MKKLLLQLIECNFAVQESEEHIDGSFSVTFVNPDDSVFFIAVGPKKTVEYFAGTSISDGNEHNIKDLFYPNNDELSLSDVNFEELIGW